ncbi:MAG: fasciclin domain-containing protein [Granulosicoccus sp.]
MIKKYFAMTIIAASVSLAACSDDDDPAPATTPEMPGTPDPDTMEPGTTDPEPMEPEVPAATPGVGGTAFDTIVNSADHQMLEDVITAAGLADTLDNPESQFTVFAPTDAAITAAAAALGDDFPTGDALARVLQYHVLSGTVNAMAATEVLTNAGDNPATVPTLLVDLAGTENEVTQVLTLSAGDGANGLAVNDINVDAVDVVILGEGETAESTPSIGLVHVIGSVLIPPAAPEAPVSEPGPENPDAAPGETTGPADAALAAAGTSEIYRTAIDRDFEGFFDTQVWTFFVPSDATLEAAGVTDLTAAQLQSHIVTNAALDPAGLAAAESVSASDNSVYTIATDADGNTTVDGNVVMLIGTGEAGAQIYSIDGILGN